MRFDQIVLEVWYLTLVDLEVAWRYPEDPPLIFRTLYWKSVKIHLYCTMKMLNFILKTTSWTNFDQTWNIASGLKKLFRWISMSITEGEGGVHVIAKRQKHVYKLKNKVSPQKPHSQFHLNLPLGIQTCSHERPHLSPTGESCGIMYIHVYAGLFSP